MNFVTLNGSFDAVFQMESRPVGFSQAVEISGDSRSASIPLLCLTRGRRNAYVSSEVVPEP